MYKAKHYAASEDRYQAGMKYRRCGETGIRLPAVSLGLWQNFGDVAPLDRSRDIILTAFDKGICHFDLANNYGPSFGSAESTFGQVFESDLKHYREELFISTKAGYDMYPGLYGNGGSRKYLMNSLDDSLRRMNLDYVDVFYSHRYDPETPLEETMQALVDIVRSGKAIYAGISNYPTEVARKAMAYLEERDVHCILHQCKYNMLHRVPEETGLLDQARENGTGFIAFSPLAQGLLTGRYLDGKVPAGSRASVNYSLKESNITPELVAKLNALNGIAAKRGQSLAQMALAWVLRDPVVASVIVGASSVAQLEDNMKAVQNLEFTQGELIAIDNLCK